MFSLGTKSYELQENEVQTYYKTYLKYFDKSFTFINIGKQDGTIENFIAYMKDPNMFVNYTNLNEFRDNITHFITMLYYIWELKDSLENIVLTNFEPIEKDFFLNLAVSGFQNHFIYRNSLSNLYLELGRKKCKSLGRKDFWNTLALPVSLPLLVFGMVLKKLLGVTFFLKIIKEENNFLTLCQTVEHDTRDTVEIPVYLYSIPRLWLNYVELILFFDKNYGDISNVYGALSNVQSSFYVTECLIPTGCLYLSDNIKPCNYDMDHVSFLDILNISSENPLKFIRYTIVQNNIDLLLELKNLYYRTLGVGIKTFNYLLKIIYKVMGVTSKKVSDIIYKIRVFINDQKLFIDANGIVHFNYNVLLTDESQLHKNFKSVYNIHPILAYIEYDVFYAYSNLNIVIHEKDGFFENLIFNEDPYESIINKCIDSTILV